MVLRHKHTLIPPITIPCHLAFALGIFPDDYRIDIVFTITDYLHLKYYSTLFKILETILNFILTKYLEKKNTFY